MLMVRYFTGSQTRLWRSNRCPLPVFRIPAIALPAASAAVGYVTLKSNPDLNERIPEDVRNAITC